MSSTIDKLRAEFSEMSETLAALIQRSKVHYADWDRGRGVVVIAPDYYFDQLPPDDIAEQLSLKRRYERWLERLRVLLKNAPNQLTRDLKSADEHFRLWLEFHGDNWSLKIDPNHNVQRFQGQAAEFVSILAIFGASTPDLFLVPDTNSLLQSADAAGYRIVAGREDFTFTLLPTVLRELDQLKILHRVPEVREKAQKAVTRIKGWRNQGSLLTGVTVDGTIRIVAIAEEPQVLSTLSWLDPDCQDDRLLASILRIAFQPSHERGGARHRRH